MKDHLFYSGETELAERVPRPPMCSGPRQLPHSGDAFSTSRV